VSEELRKPLISLTTNDIGINVSTVEKNLSKWQRLAVRWGALLLIDEADVYLGRRSRGQSMELNSIVSGEYYLESQAFIILLISEAFLHVFDYYRGLLFLTTNSVGDFDEAVGSRINLAIEYPLFNDDTRWELWRRYLAELKEGSSGYQLEPGLKDWLKDSEDLKRLNWNGRQIRNGK
jgi:hypothetical protein